jgi:two-component system, OmpR family, sensor histidine kinase MprB
VSLRARITFLVAAAVGLAAALVALAAYLTVAAQLHTQFDAQLLSRARAVGNTNLTNPFYLQTQDASILKALGLQVADVDFAGNAVYALGGTQFRISKADVAVAQGKQESVVHGAPGHLRIATIHVGPGQAVLLAESTSSTDRTLARLRLVELLVGIVGVGAAALAGFAVARAGLRPVVRLTAAAEDVARTGRPEPIEVEAGATEDEISRLAVAFNAMLAALAVSRDRQNRLVADAGHELRTPLTSLRTNLDLLAQSDAQGSSGGATLDAVEREALLADVRAQVEELGSLVGDVIELAREDAARAVSEPVELSAVVDRAIERVRRRAPAIAFDVRVNPWHLEGDPAQLERAVVNLLDNAIRWSPPHGTVHVRLDRGVLHVADEGPGIPADDLPHVFERFYRSATARATPGSGLGLAIVRQAADRHGGRVAASAGPGGGALLTLALPGSGVDPGSGVEPDPDAGLTGDTGHLS